MSQARVWRVESATGSVIVKAAPGGEEARFYADVAPRLRPQGVPIPRLEHHETSEHENWIVLEDARTPLPDERWGPDPEIAGGLARLHASELVPPPLPGYVAEWTSTQNELALSMLPEAARARLSGVLEGVRREAQFLFEPVAWISGDPNPTNWGLRDDGTLALFDWERFTRAHPAIDLAIAVPGLGTNESFARMLIAYAVAGGDARMGRTVAPRRALALAKAWTAVGLLSDVARGRTRPGIDVEWLRWALPEWFAEQFLPMA